MIKVEINRESYNLPEAFTVAQWLGLVQWDFENPKHWPRIFEIALGVDPKLMEGDPTEGETLAISFILSTMNQRELVESVDLNGLTFGQFVDLDVYVNMGIEKHLQDMLDVMESPIEMAPQALNQIEQYVNWRTSIYRQYSQLFDLHDKDFEEYTMDKETRDPLDVARGWYKIIVELANDNLLDIDAVTDQPLKKVLNFMALQKEKKLAEAEQLRKQRALQKAR